MSREITIKLDQERMDTLLKLAADKGTNAEHLVKTWVTDRIRTELHVQGDNTTAELQKQLVALETLISRLVPEQRS